MIQLLVGSALAVLAGRGLALRRPARAWTAFYVVALWIATFSPVPMLGNPDAVRSSMAAATLVLFLPAFSTKATIVLSAVLLVVAAGAVTAAPHAGTLGELEFAVGATWPRGWSDVARTGGLFLLGSVWGRSAEPERQGR